MFLFINLQHYLWALEAWSVGNEVSIYGNEWLQE